MKTIDFIFQRATSKFVEEAERDLYRYKRFLEKQIRDNKDVEKAKPLLGEVNKALGETTKPPEAIKEDNWEKRQEKKKEAFKKAAVQAINENFDLD